MEKYSDAEIAKIIDKCEILILPENSSIEEALGSENQLESNLNEKNLFSSIDVDAPEAKAEDTEEDFERIFQASKANKQQVSVPKPADFSHLRKQPSTSSSEEKPNPERALIINRELKDRLFLFRQKLLKMIEKIDAQLKANNLFLEISKSSNAKDSTNFKSSYIKCGAPFFKDANGCPAPFNSDYKFRRDVNKEFFPFDLPPSSERWRTKEKVALINGVKSQMINHIKSGQSQKLCRDSRKTRSKVQKLKFISHNKDLEQSPIMEMYQTIQKDYPDFKINWNLISFNDLQSNHSVTECMGMWYSYLRPDINRNLFTDEENQILANAMVDNDYRDWNEVAQKLDRRSSLQAFVQVNTTFSRLCPMNVRWTEDEDAKLLEAIEKNNFVNGINWSKVGHSLPLRNKRQCYNRYMTTFKTQGIKKGVFSKQEDRIIMEYVAKMGESSFNKMPKDLLPGRTMIQIKNHFNVALKHKGMVHPWTKEEDKQLIEFVGINGTNDWRGISDILQTHNRLSCRTRFLTITKYLAKNPGATVEDVPSKLKKLTAVQRAAVVSSGEEDKGESSNRVLRNKSFGTLSFELYKKNYSELYKMLRTTFNYDLGCREVVADNLKLLVLRHLFKAENMKVVERKPFLFTSTQLLKYYEIIYNFELDSKLVSEMKFTTQNTQFLMPPNYNTVVGLRAITIKMLEDSNTDELREPIEDPTHEYSNALVDFQKLFFSLFYWSAMLNKLDKGELNRTHFQKDPKANLTLPNIVRVLKNRQLPFFQQRSQIKTYPPQKKLKLSDD